MLKVTSFIYMSNTRTAPTDGTPAAIAELIKQQVQALLEHVKHTAKEQRDALLWWV